MYQFHQMHTQICMTLTLSNLIVRRIRLMVFDIPFILICNWIKQAEIVKKTVVCINPNLYF